MLCYVRAIMARGVSRARRCGLGPRGRAACAQSIRQRREWQRPGRAGPEHAGFSAAEARDHGARGQLEASTGRVGWHWESGSGNVGRKGKRNRAAREKAAGALSAP